MTTTPTFRSRVLLQRLEDTAVSLRAEQLTLEQLDKMFLTIAGLMEFGLSETKRIGTEWTPES